MKTKIIPFDLEMAKKIQAGKIKGRIRQKHGEGVQVLCWDLVNNSDNMLAVRHLYFEGDELHGEHVDEYGASGLFYDRSDGLEQNDLVLEVPYNEPVFKPFDRVLVRDDNDSVWRASIFSHIIDGSPFRYACAISNFKQCIQYEGNEDLVGTAKNPKED